MVVSSPSVHRRHLRAPGLARAFGNDHPVELDLGAGDGGFALAYAKQHPEINLLAVERLLGRVRKIEKRAARAGLANLRVLRLEFGYTVRYLLPPESVSIAHILFPDPWPKRRHWPRRLIQAPFRARPGGGAQAGRRTPLHDRSRALFRDRATGHPRSRCAATCARMGLVADPKTDFQQTFDAEGRATYRARWVKLIRS